MAIPDFQSFMLPVLQAYADDAPRQKRDIYDSIAQVFDLTSDERRQLLPSGRQEIYLNRIAWALSHLKHAGLLISPQRGVYRITPRGKTVLASNPPKIDNAYLARFPEFVAFREGRKSSAQEPETPATNGRTPQEDIEYGYQQITDDLVASILEEIRSCSPVFFERLVVDLLLAMGYGGSRAEAGRVTRQTGDEGIDGVIDEDKLGLDTIYIQAKRWESPVGRPEIQKFAGALLGQQARKGIFITTSTFSGEARKYADKIDSRIVLIDGNRLARLMIEHGVGVATVQRYDIKRIDSDYFAEE